MMELQKVNLNMAWKRPPINDKTNSQMHSLVVIITG